MIPQVYVDLLRAIRAHSGLERSGIREAWEHGADAGWPGFTYTADGAEFYRAHRDDVWAVLDEAADAYGYGNVPAFVATFNRVDLACTAEGFECLLSWFVLEEVGRYACERREGRP